MYYSRVSCEGEMEFRGHHGGAFGGAMRIGELVLVSVILTLFHDQFTCCVNNYWLYGLSYAYSIICVLKMTCCWINKTNLANMHFITSGLIHIKNNSYVRMRTIVMCSS